MEFQFPHWDLVKIEVGILLAKHKVIKHPVKIQANSLIIDFFPF